MSIFKPMLSGDALAAKVIQFPLLVSPKLDGIRAIVDKDWVRSRSLKMIPNKHVQWLLGRPEYDGFDGELIVGSPTDPRVYGTTESAVMSVNGEPKVKLYAFDFWKTPEVPYKLRNLVLQERIDNLSPELRQSIIVVEQTVIANAEELADYEERAVGAGYEGVMLRSLDRKSVV